MKTGLRHAHFQLTDRCNLACRFCGQSKGMLGSAHSEMAPEVWLNLADKLKNAAEEAGERPSILLWGGEPLLYPAFDSLAETLHHRGFELGIVTNGMLLDRHLKTVKTCIDRIHVSVDGIGAVHDSVRGNGVFEALSRNLRELDGRSGRLIFLTTVSDCNVNGISRLPFELAKLGADEIILQQLMYLSPKEIGEYRAFSRMHFGCDYPELSAWERADDSNYLAVLKTELGRIAHTEYPVPVRFTPHAYPDHMDAPPCEAPFTRVHIRHDGETGFCTDYFGFSAGSIRDHALTEIFRSGRAEEFRKAIRENSLSTCLHCPWRLQKTL